MKFKQAELPSMNSLIFWLILLVSALVLILNSLFLYGWVTHTHALTPLYPDIVPLQFITALTLFFIGLSTLLFALNFRLLSSLIALAPLITSVLMLLEYGFNLDFKIDSIFAFSTLAVFPYPGRLALNTAACTLLISVALITLNYSSKLVINVLVSLFLAISFAISFLALLGYSIGIQTAYEWGSFNQMSFYAALSYALLSISLWSCVHLFVNQQHPLLLYWLPFNLALAILMITIGVWQALKTQEKVFLNELSKNEAEHVRDIFRHELLDVQRDLKRLAEMWQIRESNLSFPQWENEAKIFLSEQNVPSDLIQFDSSLNNYWSTQQDKNSVELLKARLQQEPKKNLGSSEFRLYYLDSQKSDLVIWQPINAASNFAGEILAQTFDFKKFIQKILDDISTERFNICILDNQKHVFLNSNEEEESVEKEGHALINFPFLQWEIQVWPKLNVLNKERSNLPLIALIFGSMIALLTSSTSHLWQLTRLRRLKLEHALSDLSASTLQNEIILNSMNEGILGLNLQGKIDFINQAALEMLHYSNPKDIRDSILALGINLPPALGQFESNFKRTDGTVIPVEYSTKLITSNQNKTGYLIVFRNLTAKKESEKAIQKVENLFQAVINNATAIIYVKDLSFNYLILNKMALEFFGVVEKDIIGKNDYDFISRPEADRIRKNDQQVFLHGEPLSFEETVYKSDGNSKTFFSVKFPLRDDKGNVYALCGISTDITERKNLEMKMRAYLEQLEAINKQLEQSKQEAEKANIAKTAFINAISHELRTPLNAMIGLSSILLKGQLNEKQEKFVTRIYLSGRILNDLINDILDFARLEKKELILEPILINIKDLVKELAELFKMRAEDKDIELSLDFDPLIPTQVLADPFRLRQLLIKLLTNAVKFTKEGSVRIKVKCLSQTNQQVNLRFEIIDTGIGIAPENYSLLFQKFSQIDYSSVRQYGGTGLGLAMSKTLVDLMQGKIGFESELGKGSTFWFEVSFKLQNSQNEQLPPEK